MITWIAVGTALVLLAVFVRNRIVLQRVIDERAYLDKAACVEHDRAAIAFQLLYEAHAKHNGLSWEDTIQMIESIREEPNAVARQAIADRIICQHIEAKDRHIGF